MADIQNLISFLGFNVTSLVFERQKDFNAGEFEVNVEYLSEINSENSNLFKAVFIVNLTSKDKLFSLQVKAEADFLVNGQIPQDIYDSFVNVNAPAIAYPYLRAFVSNLVLQAGMAPIIMAPINFTKKALKKSSQDSDNISEQK